MPLPPSGKPTNGHIPVEDQGEILYLRNNHINSTLVRHYKKALKVREKDWVLFGTTKVNYLSKQHRGVAQVRTTKMGS